MRILGISALVLSLVSLICWFANWVLLTFFIAMYAPGNLFRYVGQTLGFLSSITEYIAVILVSIGLIIATKSSVKND